MKIYKLTIDSVMNNAVDIDGKNLSYTVIFDEDIEKAIMGGMQVDFDGCEAYNEVIEAFDKASRELLKAIRLMESYE